MPASDDENDDGESEIYETTSPAGNVWESDTTLAEIAGDARTISRKKGSKRMLEDLRGVLRDLEELVEANEHGRLSDTLAALTLPDGWTKDKDGADEEDDGE